MAGTGTIYAHNSIVGFGGKVSNCVLGDNISAEGARFGNVYSGKKGGSSTGVSIGGAVSNCVIGSNNDVQGARFGDVYSDEKDGSTPHGVVIGPGRAHVFKIGSNGPDDLLLNVDGVDVKASEMTLVYAWKGPDGKLVPAKPNVVSSQEIKFEVSIQGP